MQYGSRVILALGMVVWLVLALPMAVLAGYCALGDE